jgi:hypothetical protein
MHTLSSYLLSHKQVASVAYAPSGFSANSALSYLITILAASQLFQTVGAVVLTTCDTTSSYGMQGVAYSLYQQVLNELSPATGTNYDPNGVLPRFGSTTPCDSIGGPTDTLNVYRINTILKYIEGNVTDPNLFASIRSDFMSVVSVNQAAQDISNAYGLGYVYLPGTESPSHAPISAPTGRPSQSPSFRPSDRVGDSSSSDTFGLSKEALSIIALIVIITIGLYAAHRAVRYVRRHQAPAPPQDLPTRQYRQIENGDLDTARPHRVLMLTNGGVGDQILRDHPQVEEID